MSVKQKFTGDASQLERELSKLQQQYQKMLDTAGASAKKVNDQGSETEKTLRNWGSGIATAAASYFTLDQAVQLVSASYERQNNILVEATQRTQDLSDARMRLAQISIDADDFKGLKKKAQDLATQTGFSEDDTIQLVFASRSSGFSNELDNVAKASEAIGIDAAIQLAGKTKNLFGGDLTAMQTIGGMLAASSAADSDVGQLAAQMPNVAAAAQGTGIQPAELMASIGVFDKFAGSASDGATEMRNFLSKVNLRGDKSGIDKSGTLGQILDQVAALDEEQLRTVFGEDQGSNQAIRKFAANRQLLNQFASDVNSAINSADTTNDLINQKLANRFSDPAELAARQSRLAKVQLEVDRENNKSVPGSAFDRRGYNLSNALIQSDRSPIAQYMGEWAGNTAGFLGVQSYDQFGVGVADVANRFLYAQAPIPMEGRTASGRLEEINQQQLKEMQKLTSMISQQQQEAKQNRGQNPVLQAQVHSERD